MEWIKVEDKLPDDEGLYLTYPFWEETNEYTGYYCKDTNKWIRHDNEGYPYEIVVTHWALLLEPSK
jgi:hypothetical protein